MHRCVTLSCQKYMGKSCYCERDYTAVLVFCFFFGLDQFKPQVWQKLNTVALINMMFSNYFF